jgi:NAD-dependent dihydropyrimidine dehydrogenase PreA subunit
MARRDIIRIDESLCNGCGQCIPACAEGALQIIDGKARLVSEIYCDGLGACLGTCPQDAITIETREASDFDEAAARQHLIERDSATIGNECGCASAEVKMFEESDIFAATGDDVPRISQLEHWPVQLTLLPPSAPFLKGADLLLTADCVPFAYADYHRDYIKGHVVTVACPKLDDYPAHLERLTAILRESSPLSLTVVRMEVPCCSGLTQMARQAIERSGRDIPQREVVIGIDGQRQS